MRHYCSCAPLLQLCATAPVVRHCSSACVQHAGFRFPVAPGAARRRYALYSAVPDAAMQIVYAVNTSGTARLAHGRLQELAGEDPSSSDSDSQEDLDQRQEHLDQPADEPAALNHAHDAQEGGSGTQWRSACNGASARAAEASGAQGCSGGAGSGGGGKARASRAAGAGADIDNADDSLRTYLQIVQSSQLDSEKTSTISALLRTESDHAVLSVFAEKGNWVGTGEAAHFQGLPVWSEVAAALLTLMEHAGSARACNASRASSSRHAKHLPRGRSRSQGSQGLGQAPQAPDAHQEHLHSAAEVPAALSVVTPSASGAGAEDLSARALAQAGDVALASEGASDGASQGASQGASEGCSSCGAAGSGVDKAHASAHASPKRLKRRALPVRVCMYGASVRAPRWQRDSLYTAVYRLYIGPVGQSWPWGTRSVGDSVGEGPSSNAAAWLLPWPRQLLGHASCSATPV